MTLVSLSFMVTMLALAVLAAAGFVTSEIVRGIRRRRGRPVVRGIKLVAWRLTGVVVTLLLAGSATLTAINRQYSYIPSFAALFGNVSPDLVSKPISGSAGPLGHGKQALGISHRAPLDHGVVEKDDVAGARSGIGARDTYVYLPPQYFSEPDRRFPVLYLLHGSPGVSLDWLRGGWADRSMDELLRRNKIVPFIVVMPDVNGGYGRDVECQDIPRGPQAQTYLVEDVVAFVDTHYRTIADREGRAIGGLSTGGYCGINLTLRHQDVFSAAISHSGYGRPDHNTYTGSLFGGDESRRLANTPSHYLPSLAIRQPLGVYLDAGSADSQSRAESAALYQVMRRRGVDVTYNVVKNEGHSFAAWRENLTLSLPWVSDWFSGTAATRGSSIVAPPVTDYLPPLPPLAEQHCGPASSAVPRGGGGGGGGRIGPWHSTLEAVAPPTTPPTTAHRGVSVHHAVCPHMAPHHSGGSPAAVPRTKAATAAHSPPAGIGTAPSRATATTRR